MPTISPSPTQPTGKVRPVASWRFLAQRPTRTAPITPTRIIASTIAEPSSKMGEGRKMPRLLRKAASPSEMLSRTLGSASMISHQKMIWSSTGTLRVNSTQVATMRLTRKLFERRRTPATKPMTVAVTIPIAATRMVLSAPTTKACP